MKRKVILTLLSLIFLSSCVISLPDFIDVTIIKVEQTEDGGLVVYLRGAKEGYTVTVGDQTFSCEMLDDPEGVLKCTGPVFKPGEEQVVRFYKGDDTTEPLAELVFVVPEYTPGEDSDGDGTPDGEDLCPADSAKGEPGICGCGLPETDTDQDGTPDCKDGCPANPDLTSAGQLGCELRRSAILDQDGVPDSEDKCPEDPLKDKPGECGCGVADLDEDQDGFVDCEDQCPIAYADLIGDPCDKDEDNDGIQDGADQCPFDPNKKTAGYCGCGSPETDTDQDGTPDCVDLCPLDKKKIQPGICGCGVTDKDSDGDGTPDCKDSCPTGDLDSDGDGTKDCLDGCPLSQYKTEPGVCGCG